jgi:hypothetical protein
MTGLFPGGVVEFSTYRRSQKVVNLERNPRACVVVAPRDRDRALVLHGRAEIADGQHEPATGGSAAPKDIRVADGVGERARARMKEGKRVVLRFTPDHAEFIPGVDE